MTLLVIVIFLLGIAYEFKQAPFLQTVRQEFESTFTEFKTVSSAFSTKNYVSAFDVYKPVTNVDQYTLPSTILIPGNFQPAVKDIIKSVAFSLQKYFPLEDLGQVVFYDDSTNIQNEPLPEVSGDSGVSYIFTRADGATDENSSVYMVRRAFLSIYAYRVLSTEEKSIWLKMRGVSLPSFLDNHWNYTVTPDSLKTTDYIYSPYEDFVNVFINSYLDSDWNIFTNKNQSVYPEEKLFIRSTMAKLINGHLNNPFAVPESTVLNLKQNITTYAPYLPTDKNICPFDAPIIKEGFFLIRCDNTGINNPAMVELDIVQNKDIVSTALHTKFENPNRVVKLSNNQQVNAYDSPSGTDDIYATVNGDNMFTAINLGRTFLLYQIPGASEVAVVNYKSDSNLGKEQAEKILVSLKKI